MFSLPAAIIGFCFGLSGCCTSVFTSPFFQQETRLCFPLLINDKFNFYKRCLGKDHAGDAGVKKKYFSFTCPASFHGQLC